MSLPDEDAIVDCVTDYFEGWYDGDPVRMERALHPELAKRAPEGDGLDETTAAWMIEATREGRGKRDDPVERRFHVSVVDVHGPIAAAVVHSTVYREYVHLVKTSAGWKIVAALWQPA